jgi:hypothetical protein
MIRVQARSAAASPPQPAGDARAACDAIAPFAVDGELRERLRRLAEDLPIERVAPSVSASVRRSPEELAALVDMRHPYWRWKQAFWE